MVEIQIKRVYEHKLECDGFRVLVDRLWPRGIKKENLQYDLWEKNIAPSSELRKWMHIDPESRWNDFVKYYTKELRESSNLKTFIDRIQNYKTVTLLTATKDKDKNYLIVLRNVIYQKLTLNNKEKTSKES